ncbi:MAG: DUF4928 family protein [Oscillospiraceae bacterium]|jgi:hypothetical protein|nr:DUF4928 family protein [Oscillospiraceae bacterium]
MNDIKKGMDNIIRKLCTFQSDNEITDIQDIRALLELTRLMKKRNYHLNSEKATAFVFDLKSIYEYSDTRPFQLVFDSNVSIRAVFDDLFAAAKQRQEENKKVNYREMLLCHLVEAVISTILPDRAIQIHNASAYDLQMDRGDGFLIGSIILHCTTMPSELLIEKCRGNIRFGFSPIIITIFERVRTMFDLVADAGLNGRIEVWDIQQFLSANVSEHSLFDGTARNTKLAEIIEKYNEIITKAETDPSLRIEFEAK